MNNLRKFFINIIWNVLVNLVHTDSNLVPTGSNLVPTDSNLAPLVTVLYTQYIYIESFVTKVQGWTILVSRSHFIKLRSGLVSDLTFTVKIKLWLN